MRNIFPTFSFHLAVALLAQSVFWPGPARLGSVLVRFQRVGVVANAGWTEGPWMFLGPSVSADSELPFFFFFFIRPVFHSFSFQFVLVSFWPVVLIRTGTFWFNTVESIQSL